MTDLPTLVLLTNYGGPTSEKEIKPYLRRLFSDPAVFPIPKFLRTLLGFIVSHVRSRETFQILQTLGGKSPLISQTQEKANKLQEMLGSTFHFRVAMRYSHPLLEEYLKNYSQLRKKYKRLVVLPMFPHYSFSTYGSIERLIKDHGLENQITLTRPFYNCPLFIEGWKKALKKTLQEFYKQNPSEEPFILFSAHSLPLYLVKKGDPYPQQVKESVELIMEGFNLSYSIGYQSKVGPISWLEPSTEEVIFNISKKGVKHLIVLPISFTAENSETLYEIDIQYRQLAKDLGFKTFKRVPIPYLSTDWLNCLKELIEV